MKIDTPIVIKSCGELRSSYTMNNASLFKTYIDESMSEHGCSVIVPFEHFKSLKPRTIFNKLTDAIKWLSCELEDKEKREAYAVWAQSIRKGYVDNPVKGIVLMYIEEGANRQGIKATGGFKIKERQTNTKWKEQFLNWLDIGDAMNPLSIKGLALSEEEQAWVNDTCAEFGFEKKVTTTSIVCAKPLIKKV